MDHLTIETLYLELKERKPDYVITGKIVTRISELIKYCPSNQETFIWFLGGPIFWLISWNVNRKLYKANNISTLEKRIIAILANYEVTFKNGYCVMIKKEI
ncbi:hypothetical protein [Enterococcus rivorum]|uniref:Uncharacterized protein n=1 Tax=Enterococcus rivorum TaxID=762845 RepID=A0A1E5KW90_9ENTE|nr:hypothetical protein [Enterococcus rivorum]MBP2100068.1 hypothetical protein [Enterococcus rivorum]OEH82115.1 hypothetical protein BCR26_14345 [Enterococcus rivorum]